MIVTLASLNAILPGNGFAEPAAQSNSPIPSTLYSGDFDDYLMLATDSTANVIEGYYNDGKCRFSFRGALSPTTLYQRSDFGEAYEVDSWDPVRPELHFTTTIYSRARGGYQTQLTLEPGHYDDNRPVDCRWRITLDRSNNNKFIGVRVVRRSNAPVFEIKRRGEAPRRLTTLSRLERVPAPRVGVWVAETYSAEYSPEGYVYANWYNPPGTPRGGYIRARDLYPLPEIPSQPEP